MEEGEVILFLYSYSFEYLKFSFFNSSFIILPSPSYSVTLLLSFILPFMLRISLSDIFAKSKFHMEPWISFISFSTPNEDEVDVPSSSLPSTILNP
ncbi:MAG: hypothetical protein SPI52_07190 [Bacilli bacterium]|nr:hypothetical protein [Bacilli bacterium]